MTKLLLLANLLCLFSSANFNKKTDTNFVQKETVSTASSVIKKEIKCDAKPILSLSFDQLIDLSINYLQNLEGMLEVISKNAHEKDAISNSIKEEILDLFTGNEVNSYELNEHIKTVLGESMDDIFEGQSAVSLSYFCDKLAHSTKSKLITLFKTTSIKELKKDFGKNFSKYKNNPYPSVRKILRAIDLNDIPFDVQRDVDKERRINNLASWYKSFRQQLDIFEQEHKTDLLNNALLQEKLKEFGNSLTDVKITPPSCKLHLFDNVVNKLGSKSIVKALDVISIIKTELDTLCIKIEASIQSESFEGSDDLDFFLGIRTEHYLSYVRIAVEKNRFKEYKETMKDWVISVDTLMNGLGVDEEKEKYKYKSKLIALNLSKLFRTEHGLIDFSDFINPIIKELRARDTSMKLSEIDALFATSIANASSSIYANLANLYYAEMEKGSFVFSFDTLKIALPSMLQIQHAIVSAKE